MSWLSKTTFLELLDFSTLDGVIESACQLAVQEPKALYLLMQRYTHFNSYAGALAARLASTIGISHDLFNKHGCLVADEADRGLAIAHKVIAATDLEHRTLAQFTLKTIGDYAELNTAERNQFSVVPTWLREIVNELIQGYQGTPGDISSMIRAMGFHVASEIMADREYTLLDKVVRHDNKSKGFDAYLEKVNDQVEVEGHKYMAWDWVMIHATHDFSGAEVEHFELAIEALNITAQSRPETKQQIWEWVFQGFSHFLAIEQRLYKEIYQECLALVKLT